MLHFEIQKISMVPPPLSTDISYRLLSLVFQPNIGDFTKRRPDSKYTRKNDSQAVFFERPVREVH